MSAPYWAVAQLEANRERVALHHLGLSGYQVYSPRCRPPRTARRQPGSLYPPLFPNYCFVLIQLQWHTARWCPGVVRLVLSGEVPAAVPDVVIAEIRARECNGLIDLPGPSGPQPGSRVRIMRGALADNWAIFVGLKPRDRVTILLEMLGSQRELLVPARHIELA